MKHVVSNIQWFNLNTKTIYLQNLDKWYMSENFCQQRQAAQLGNIPQIRFTLNSPYVGNRFTQFDLNMRRKAEILKYAPNLSASQTNKQTKKQLWVQIASGAGSKSLVDSPSLDLEGLVCPDEGMMLVPNYDADVPGPLFYLYEDNSVPLYNFGNNNERSYPDNVNASYEMWTVITAQDLLMPDNTETQLCKLIVKDNVDAQKYNFSFSTGVGMNVSGKIANTTTNKIAKLTVSLDSVSVLVYYSGSKVQQINVPATLTSLVFDVSGIDVNNDLNGKFKATQFVGNIITPNVTLYTQPGYVYDVKLRINLNITSAYNYFEYININSYANISPMNNEISNCYVWSTPSTAENLGFKLAFSSA